MQLVLQYNKTQVTKQAIRNTLHSSNSLITSISFYASHS